MAEIKTLRLKTGTRPCQVSRRLKLQHLGIDFSKEVLEMAEFKQLIALIYDHNEFFHDLAYHSSR